MSYGMLKILSGLTFGSVLVVFILKLLADNSDNVKQEFVRTYHPDLIQPGEEIKVDEDTYVAGLTTRKLYLGNEKNGIILLQVDLRSLDVERVAIRIDADLLHPHVRIDSPHIFVSDGHKAALYTGRLENWTANRSFRHLIPFVDAQVISPVSVVLRAINRMDENAIVKISEKEPYQTVAKHVLINQGEGLYSTAGALHYSKFMGKVVYVYYFRNEYMLLDTLVDLNAKGNTIDLVSVSKVNSLKLTDDTYTLALPLQMVNKSSFIFKHYLFVCSAIMGSNDEEQIFQGSNTIDVYSLIDLRYLMSFKVPDYDHEKLKSFYVTDGKIVGCYQTRVVIFELATKKFEGDT